MTDRTRTASAETAQHALQAVRELERLDVLADLGEQHDNEPLPLFRQEFALRYRQLLGIHPDDRIEYRAALERVAAGGGMPISDVKAHFKCQ